jgi:23S rRNA pseudouridine2604 synthase
MTVRPTIKLDPAAAPRDPRRPRVRGAAPLPTKVAPRGASPSKPPAQPPPVPAAAPADAAATTWAQERSEPRKALRKDPPGEKRQAAEPARAPGTRTERPARPAAETPTRTAPPVRKVPKPTVKIDPNGLVRLSKLLSDRGLASRRQADDWIASGWVKVDGEVATLGQRVLPAQVIEIDPRAKAETGRSGSLHRVR